MKVKNMKEWHAIVCKNEKCEVCGMELPPNMLTGHHKKTRGSRPDLKLETNNGVCVCQQCHYKIHNGTIKLRV